MKKLLSIAILAMMVATPVFFVSCGNDDDMLPEESEITKPTIASWTEPFHDKNGTPDKVKSYMASLMSRYSLVTENAGTSSTQLVYSSASLSEGVIYSFGGTTGTLYSVIDTELTLNKGIILKYLNEHYTLIPGSASNESMLQYRFTNSDSSIVVSTMKISETCFNIDCSFISK